MPQRIKYETHSESVAPDSVYIRSALHSKPTARSRKISSENYGRQREEITPPKLPAPRISVAVANRPSSLNLYTSPIAGDKSSRSPKAARSISKHKSPPSPIISPRPLPLSPSLLRHHTTSQSEALARDFFGPAKPGRVDQSLPFFRQQSSQALTSAGHHSHQRPRQNMTTSPLLRRHNPSAQTVVPVVVSSGVSADSVDPKTLTVPSLMTPSRPSLSLPALNHLPVLPELFEQPVTATPHLSSPLSAPQGVGAPPNTGGTVSPGLRRKAENQNQNQTCSSVGGDTPLAVMGEGWRKAVPGPNSYFRVVVLGDEGVGKSTLVRQMAVTAVVDQVIGEVRNESRGWKKEEEKEEKGNAEEEGEQERVVVQLQGHHRRYTVEIFDSPLNASIDTLRPDAFIVMYSASDRKSYLTAQDVTRHLRCELGMDCTIFLVANKTDLQRQQHVPAKEAKTLAKEHDCFYVEVSAALRLNTDGLLLKLLHEITQQLLPPVEGRSRRSRVLKHNSSKRTMHFFSRLFGQALLKRTGSCSDMYYLNRYYIPTAVGDV